MNEPNADKPKLIIDEDWKSQVERERAEFRHAQESDATPAAPLEQAPSEQAPRSTSAAAEPASEEQELPPPPPASFPLLVSMLGTQALMAMGQLGEDQPDAPPRLDYAKHYIDLLGVLEEKTKNNLSSDDAHLLGDWLHQLRLAYVEMTKRKH